MIIGLIMLGVTTLVLGYVCMKQYVEMVKQEKYNRDWRTKCAKYALNIHYLMSNSRTALDGRLIVPRRVANNFREHLNND